jgi:hypothetical protein
MASSSRPSHLTFRFAAAAAERTEGGEGKVDADAAESAWARIRLLWNEAPRTCAAVAALCAGEAAVVLAVHGRHSGEEALFLTPDLIPLGVRQQNKREGVLCAVCCAMCAVRCVPCGTACYAGTRGGCELGSTGLAN